MHTTTSVISGLAVTHSIRGRGEAWRPGDLDIYTPLGKAGSMVEYLTSVEMYEIVEPPEPDDDHEAADKEQIDAEKGLGYHVHRSICWKYLQPGEPADEAHCRFQMPAATARYAGLGILSVTRLKRTANNAGLPEVTRFIEVVESASLDATTPIGQFISTFAMNWMTDNAMVVAYPKMTFSGKGIMNGRSTGEQAEHQGKWREKYETRGYYGVDGTEELGGPCAKGSQKIQFFTRGPKCVIWVEEMIFY